jgi:hypothetical protein
MTKTDNDFANEALIWTLGAFIVFSLGSICLYLAVLA